MAAAREAARRGAIACRFEGDCVATAGSIPKGESIAAADGGGYVPALQPTAAPTQEPAAAPDDLGLGLDLGLGPAPTQKPRPRGKLKIGEGC